MEVNYAMCSYLLYWMQAAFQIDSNSEKEKEIKQKRNTIRGWNFTPNNANYEGEIFKTLLNYVSKTVACPIMNTIWESTLTVIIILLRNC